jgi:recombinational DNA repair ATPase RecF
MIFEKGINYLFGLNGVGKTNLIEAIYYVSNLESFRINDDKGLLKDYKGEFYIDAIVNDLEYSLLVNKDSKLLSVDGIVYKKYREYLGKVNVIEWEIVKVSDTLRAGRPVAVLADYNTAGYPPDISGWKGVPVSSIKHLGKKFDISWG